MPANTPETPRMTAEDARQVQVLLEATGGMQIGGRYERILATYHALAEQTVECDARGEKIQKLVDDVVMERRERARLEDALAASQREVERLRAEQITRAVDALPDGTTLIKTDKLDALRAQLAAAREDTRRAVMVAIEQTVQSCAAQSKYPSETWMVDYAKILGHLP